MVFNKGVSKMAVRKGLVLAMEEQDIIKEIFDDTEDNFDLIKSELSDITSDLNYGIEEINDSYEELNDIEEDVESVESILDIINIPATESFSRETAEILNITISDISNKLGIRYNNILPSTESFSSSSSSADTAIAIENVKTFLVDLWEKIRKIVLELWSKLKDFINNIFKKTKDLEEKVEQAKKRVDDIIASKKYNNEIMTDRKLWLTFASGLSSAGPIDFDSVRSLIIDGEEGIDEGIRISKKYDEQYKILGSNFESFKKLYDIKDHKDDDVTNFITTITKNNKAFWDTFSADINGDVKLVHGKILQYKAEKIDSSNLPNDSFYDDLKKMIEEHKTVFEQKNCKWIEDGVNGEKLKCLDKSDINKIYNEDIPRLLKKIKEYKDLNPDNTISKFNRMMDLAVNISKEYSIKSQDPSKRLLHSEKAMEAFRSMILFNEKFHIKIISTFSKNAIDLIEGCINYTLLSVKMYK